MRNIKPESPIFLAVAFFLATLTIRFMSDFNGLYGQDSHEYLRFTERLGQFLGDASHPGTFFWPVNYPLCAAVLAIFIRDSAISAQLVSLLAASSIVWMVSSYLLSAYPKATERTSYMLILLLLSPLFLINSLLTMSDMLASSFVMATFFMANQLRTQPTERGCLLLLLYASCAITTRYAVAPLVLLPLLYLIRTSFLTIKPLLVVKGAIAVLIPALPHLLLRKAESGSFLSHPWLANWSFFNWPMRSFQTLDGFASYALPNAVHAASALFHPGFMALGSLLILFLRPQDIRKQLLVIGSVLLYGCFLAGIPFQNLRFLLPAFPLCFIILFPGWQRLNKWLQPGYIHYAFFVALIAAQLLLILRYANPLYQANQLEKTIASEMKHHQDETVYTFWIDLALRSYGVKNEIINLYYDRLESAKTPSLLLFNPEKFTIQWQGKNPMLNWRFLNKTYNLEQLKTLPEGWILFRVMQKFDNKDTEIPNA